MTLELPHPPSVNHYWRQGRGRMHISAEGKSYRAAVMASCRFPAPMLGRLAVSIRVEPPDRRRRDLDNTCKALLDALAHAGVYEDDSQIDRLVLERGDVCRPHGRVLVTVEEMQ